MARIAPLGAIVAGLCAAAGIKLPRLVAIGLSVVAGGCVGAGTQVDAPSTTTAIGVGACAVLLMLFAWSGFDWMEKITPLARRIVGAWVGAIGLLIAALALKG